MQTIDRAQRLKSASGALLAGAALLAALVFVAPGEALAACGTGASSGVSAGAHPASAGTGGTFSGSHASAGSSGASSCGVSATTSSGTHGAALRPLLTGVHGPGGIIGNGGKRNGSTTLSRTANTVTNVSSTHTAKVAGATHTGGGAHFYRPGKHP